MWASGAALAAAILILCCNISASAQKATPEMFGALPTISQAALSPDGNTVAVIQSDGATSSVLFFDLADKSAKPTGYQIGAVKTRSLQWVDDEHLLLLISDARRVHLQTAEIWRWMSLPRRGKPVMLFENERRWVIFGAGELVSTLPQKTGHALFSRLTSQAQGPASDQRALDPGVDTVGYSLLSVNLATGKSVRVEGGSKDTIDWAVNENGEAVLRLDYDRGADKLQFLSRSPQGRSFVHAASLEHPRGGAMAVRPYSTSNGQTVIASVPGEGGRRALVEYDLSTGENKRVIFSNAQFDIGEVIYDPFTARVTAVAYIDDLPRMLHLDPSDQALQQRLADALPQAGVVQESRAADGSRVIFRASYTDRPSQFFLYERATDQFAFLFPTYSSLDGKVVARKEKYDYTASDGLRINGYLTVPEGASRAVMPLVVMSHGGPEARDDQSFDWWAFFYAARGYLVYQPNFRGSSGYGLSFRTAGHGEWGGKMQDDITEGVKKLIADGLADPSRICVVGGSYGGYAALAGATLTPDVYACAVSVNGVSDLESMLDDSKNQHKTVADYWKLRIGSDKTAVRAVSPRRLADRATAPIMLIHGRDDTVVPFAQSKMMADALKAAKKPHELVALKGEDHWLSSAETRIEMLARSIDFIDRHIGGGN